MKISELIALLEQRKEEYGDTDVVIYDHRTDCLENLTGSQFVREHTTEHRILELY